MAALEDLEARVAALEASQADYRAVLAAVNALLSARNLHVDVQIAITKVANAFATGSDNHLDKATEKVRIGAR